jgi:hypothetical protein
MVGIGKLCGDGKAALLDEVVCWQLLYSVCRRHLEQLEHMATGWRQLVIAVVAFSSQV